MADHDRRADVGPVQPAHELGRRDVDAPVEGRRLVVVDRQPVLVVEDRLVGEPDERAVAAEHDDRPLPVDTTVGRTAHGHVALGDAAAGVRADVLELPHEGERTVHRRRPRVCDEARRGVAGAVPRAEGDLSVEPRRATVERREEPGGDDDVPRTVRVVEAVEVVVRAAEKVVRVLWINRDGDLVVWIPVLTVRLRVVAAHVDRDRRISRARTAVRGYPLLRERARLRETPFRSRVHRPGTARELLERVHLAAVLLVDGASATHHREDDQRAGDDESPLCKPPHSPSHSRVTAARAPRFSHRDPGEANERVRANVRKKERGAPRRPFWSLEPKATYIIPPMSGMPPPAIAGCFSGASATIASVVRMFLAIDAAFWSAERVTIVGSMIPAFTRSSYTPVSTLSPWPLVPRWMVSTTTEPSRPALSASWRIGSSSERATMLAPVRSSPS